MTPIDKMCKAGHDAYETKAKELGWITQESCRVEWEDLPELNKEVMRFAYRAALRALGELPKEKLASWISDFQDIPQQGDREWDEISMFRYCVRRVSAEEGDNTGGAE